MALPGAFSGILWMLFLTQTTFSVPSLMGSIMTIGVATANSILLVVFANDERAHQPDPVQAALSAGYIRLRPVIMTALAMILGMLPMALALGEGGEQNAPLGRAVIGVALLMHDAGVAPHHARQERRRPRQHDMHLDPRLTVLRRRHRLTGRPETRSDRIDGPVHARNRPRMPRTARNELVMRRPVDRRLRKRLPRRRHRRQGESRCENRRRSRKWRRQHASDA
jgi:hypothetical protein